MKLTDEQLELIKKEMTDFALTTVIQTNKRLDLNNGQTLAVILGEVTTEVIRKTLELTEKQ